MWIHGVVDVTNGGTKFHKSYITKFRICLKCFLQICDETIADLCHKYPGNSSASLETSTFMKFFECECWKMDILEVYFMLFIHQFL